MNEQQQERKHKKKLEELCTPDGLIAIDEIPEDVRLLIREPIMSKEGCTSLGTTPDLIIAKYDGLFTVAELKYSYQYRAKAYKQIDAGMRMLVDVFGVPLRNITGKFITYYSRRFDVEVVQ